MNEKWACVELLKLGDWKCEGNPENIGLIYNLQTISKFPRVWIDDLLFCTYLIWVFKSPIVFLPRLNLLWKNSASLLQNCWRWSVWNYLQEWMTSSVLFFVNRPMDLEARGQAPRDESEDVEAAEQGRVNSRLSSTAGRPDCHLSRW